MIQVNVQLSCVIHHKSEMEYSAVCLRACRSKTVESMPLWWSVYVPPVGLLGFVFLDHVLWSDARSLQLSSSVHRTHSHLSLRSFLPQQMLSFTEENRDTD